MAQTYRHTDGHGNSKTNISYQTFLIWTAKSSPVTDSILHTAHCPLHTTHCILHLHLHLHLYLHLDTLYYTLKTVNYAHTFILSAAHVLLHNKNIKKMCMSCPQELLDKIYPNLAVVLQFAKQVFLKKKRKKKKSLGVLCQVESNQDPGFSRSVVMHCIVYCIRHCTALHALHCTTLNYMHCIALHCTTCTALHYTALHALHYTTLHYMYCTALQYPWPYFPLLLWWYGRGLGHTHLPVIPALPRTSLHLTTLHCTLTDFPSLHALYQCPLPQTRPRWEHWVMLNEGRSVFRWVWFGVWNIDIISQPVFSTTILHTCLAPFYSATEQRWIELWVHLTILSKSIFSGRKGSLLSLINHCLRIPQYF